MNPIALDDVLFSPPAGAGLRESMEINAAAPLYATLGTPWTSQSLVTHDGIDALELPVAAAAGSRASLTFPVTGPGILTWWWRTDLPDGTAFRLHRQGRQARTLSGNSGWRQEFLALRSGEEFVRWEVFPGVTPATPSHRVWLDQVSFVPQTISSAEALDAPGQTWLGNGNALGAALPALESHDGTDALVLTPGHNAVAPLTSTVTTFTGPGSLSFWLHTRHRPQQYGYTWSILLDEQYRPVHPPPHDGWTAYAFAIPAGTHTVRWVPNTGTVMTLDEVTYTPGDGYTLWAQANIPSGQPAGPEDDPDGDGESNLLEYGFSTNPSIRNPPPPLP